jgi:hypothetical protein
MYVMSDADLIRLAAFSADFDFDTMFGLSPTPSSQSSSKDSPFGPSSSPWAPSPDLSDTSLTGFLQLDMYTGAQLAQA